MSSGALWRWAMWESAIQEALARHPELLRASELESGMRVKHIKWLKPQTVTYIVELGDQKAVYFTGGKTWQFMPGWGSDQPVFEVFDSDDYEQ